MEALQLLHRLSPERPTMPKRKSSPPLTPAALSHARAIGHHMTRRCDCRSHARHGTAWARYDGTRDGDATTNPHLAHTPL
eukprot:4375333-Alexandrium_andersonii.AAC.1